MLGNLRDRIKAQTQGQVKFEVLLASDHSIHFIMEFDKKRYAVPLTPAEAINIAAQLMSGAQAVSGFKNEGAIRIPIAGQSL